MKTIGIITIQKCNNYGADLQAYALGAKLRELGYDAENIDYLFYKNPRHERDGELEKPVLHISLANRIKEFLFPIVAALRGRRTSSAVEERFTKWFSQNVRCGREYRSVAALYKDPPKYDVYMVGSDQVWNPRLCSNIKPYFLDFAPEGARCVSYASSFGVSEFSGQAFQLYRTLLSRFDYVGLREDSGVDIVNAMAIGVPVEHVVDPTLLLSAVEWQRVAIKPADADLSGGYVLLYDLIACDRTVSEAKRIAKEKGVKVVRINGGDYGPGEFIWLFAHASVVVTNSFHGSVFAILNHKPLSVVLPDSMANRGRIDSLLSSVGLLYDNLKFDNWSDVDRRIWELQKGSIDFLVRSIEKPAAKIKPVIPEGCYAVVNDASGVRTESTSGGAFSMLASEVIRNGGVVFGAAFDSDFRHVRHCVARTIEELGPIRKSKYVWRDPVVAYRDVKRRLSQGGLVLFSGTPCQCAAIRKMVGENDDLITVDFVCHGTPKSDVFSRYVETLEADAKSKLVFFDFRDKSAGWNFPLISYKFSNGVVKKVIPSLDPYFRDFSLNRGLKDGCYHCVYANLSRPSDITIADAWRIGATMPDFDDNKGVSNVFVNTRRGMRLFESASSASSIRVRPYDLHLAQIRNHALMFVPRVRSGVRSDMYYRVVYWAKRLGWFYFKGVQ